jgi:hypothetical protein
MNKQPQKLKKYRVWLKDGASMETEAVNAMHAQTKIKVSIKRLCLGTTIVRIEELETC